MRSWRRTVRGNVACRFVCFNNLPLARKNPKAIMSRAAGQNLWAIFRNSFGHNLLSYINLNWIDITMGTKFWQAGFQFILVFIQVWFWLPLVYFEVFNVWENSEILDGGFKKNHHGAYFTITVFPAKLKLKPCLTKTNNHTYPTTFKNTYIKKNI